MGLAASQARYLALTSRKSDLEYQSQTINTRRIQLSYKTAEIAQEYSDGMSNQKIKVSQNKTSTETGKAEQVWNELTFSNLLSEGYMLIGTSGTGLDPAPYVKENTTVTKVYIPAAEETINANAYDALSSANRAAYVVATEDGDGNPLTYKLTTTLTEKQYDNLDDDYKTKFTESEVTKTNYVVNPEYSKFSNAMDIQSGLVSGTMHIVTKSFFDYLANNWGYSYDTGITTEQYSQALQQWNSGDDTINPDSSSAIIDWRSDTSDKFQQRSYTEDDEEVLAKYEAETAKIQAQDKMLEVQEKNIETQHKAIETELESIQKVIQNNIEKTFKIFT